MGRIATGARAVRRAILRGLVLALLCVCRLDPLAQAAQSVTSLERADAIHERWLGNSDGLPDGHVEALLQDRRGYLWLGTPHGVFRFDGKSFLPVAPQAQVNGVYSLCEDHDGSVWVGTYSGGLVRIGANGVFDEAAAVHGLPELESRELLVDRQGRLWVGTEFGLWLRDEQGFRQVGLETKPIRSLALGPDGRVWIASDRIYVSDGTPGMEPRAADMGLGVVVQRPSCLEWSADGKQFWIGMQGGLVCFDGADLAGKATRPRLYTAADGLSGDTTTSIQLEPDGRVWIGSANGGLAYRNAHDRFTTKTTTEGLSDDFVHELLLDREGSLWVATEGGLDRFRTRRMRTLGKAEGLSSRETWGVLDDGRGGVLVLTHALGIARMDLGRPGAHFEILENLPSESSGAWAGLLRRDGSVWIGANTGELYEWAVDGQWRPRPEIWDSYSPLSGFCEDARGDAWFSADGRIGVWNGTKAQYFNVREGNEPSPLWTILATSDGEVFAAGAHLYRRSGERFLVDWTPPADARGIFSMAEHEGHLWLGLLKQGLAVRLEDRVVQFVGPGMPTGDIYAIVRDLNGELWLSSSSGLWCVKPQALLALAQAGSGPTVEGHAGVRQFDKLDGLDSVEFNGGGQSSGAVTADGRLWFANSAGVVVVDPALLRTNPVPPTVTIESADHEDQALRLDSTLARPVGSGRLEIHYSASSLLMPARVRFEYRLEGFDPDWIDAGERRAAYYTGLRGGDYCFRVRATNEDGVRSESDATWRLALTPHWFNRPGFLALLGVGLAAALFGMHRLRLRSHVRRELDLARVVDERTAQLRTQITERERAQQELGLSNDRLEERVRDRTAEISRVNERLRRENEDRLRAESAKLDGEMRLFAIVDQLPGVIWTTDRDLMVHWMQGGLMGGKSRAPLNLRSVPVTEFAQEAPGGPATLAHVRALEGTPASFEATLYARSLRCSVQPLRDASGAITGTIGVALDVTEERRLEMQLSQAQKLDSLGRLAGGVAHDLNNLLTVILCHAENIEQSSGEERTRKETAQVLAASERAAELTRQLLAFARRQVVEPRVLAVSEVLQGLESLLRRVISENIELDLEIAADLGNVHADRSQLEQVLLNLVVNARDAMPKGGRLRILARNLDFRLEPQQKPAVLSEHEYIELSVIDNGLGMSDSVRARIFEPFFTTKAPGQGTGLGLATCYGIVQQCGGHIDVESRMGRGTSFRVLLPRTRMPVDEGGGLQQDLQSPRGNETLLLVEDEPEVRNVARAMLESLGYRLLEASDGVEALEVAAAHQGTIDLLLSDLVMPRMGGAELARGLLALRPGIRVLFISGYVGDPAALDDEVLSNVDVLPKPFTARVLAQRVRRTLDQVLAAS